MNLPPEVAKIEKAVTADIASVKAEELAIVTWAKTHAGILIGSGAFVLVIAIIAVLRHL